MSIVTNKLNQYNTKEELIALTNKLNERLSEDNKLHTNQVEAAIETLKCFDSNLPRPNHVALRGYTQGGKTGAMQAIIELIGELGIEEAMGVSDIYYVTGDNTTDLKSQSQERIEECKDSVKCDFHFLKNSDLKNDIPNSGKLTNTLLFIDESHYASSDFGNILIQWLKSKQLGMDNNIDLVEKKVYVVSVSATPYKEMVSDENKTKSYVTLETGDYYKGYKEFYENGNIVPVATNITKANAEDRFLEFRAHLDAIRNKTGEEKCAIVRISGKSYSRVVDIAEKYFRVKVIDASNGKIDYNSIYWLLSQESKYKKGKPLLLVIKGAFRMGMSIPSCAKKNIGLIFDYSSEVITTEQGLLGRITGYWMDDCKDDWKELKIYINNRVNDSLYGCYILGKCAHPLVKREKNVFIEDENGDEYDFFVYSDEIIIPCTEKFGGDEYNKLVKNYVIKYMAENIEPLDESVFWVPGRRKKDGAFNSISAFFNKKENTIAQIIKNPEFIGRNCITTLYNFDDDYISVKYAKYCRGRYIDRYISNVEPVPTMITS